MGSEADKLFHDLATRSQLLKVILLFQLFWPAQHDSNVRPTP